jgi:hypothetical protein
MEASFYPGGHPERSRIRVNIGSGRLSYQKLRTI